MQYDTSGRLRQVQLPAVPDPLNNNTLTRPTYLYEYNAQGQMTKLTDALGHITSFGFNSQAQSTSRTLPSTASESFSYDSRGRLEHAVSFEGVVTAYVYDDSAGGAGRLSEKRYWPSVAAYNNGAGTPSEIIQYTYDAFGREVRSECRPGGLEGYWKVDETSGTVAADSSGHGHNATLINGASWTAGGPFDGAITLTKKWGHVQFRRLSEQDR